MATTKCRGKKCVLLQIAQHDDIVVWRAIFIVGLTWFSVCVFLYTTHYIFLECFLYFDEQKDLTDITIGCYLAQNPDIMTKYNLVGFRSALLINTNIRL